MTTPQNIVQLLREASKAYYNGGPEKMSDETYDGLIDRLRTLDPENPYFDEVGAEAVGSGATRLPFPMPSLDKIKPGEDQLRRFLANQHTLVLSEKLDGLSALWVPSTSKLYLRGDGITGQDISHLVPLGIQGLVRTGGSVRGELIILRSEGIPLSRNWVNGQIHQSSPSPEQVRRIRFVAYESMSGIGRWDQLHDMSRRGYEIPWVKQVVQVTEAELAIILQARRKDSPYDTDGIVVAFDLPPKSESTATKAKNPKDCVAFKMPLAEQSAQTTVREVIWSPSAQGYLVPRIRFDPVMIGSARIEFCTGHNARNILVGGVGPGAEIVIRRSGDVIPKLDAVLVKVAASFPPDGTWEWIGAADTACHIRSLEGGDAMLSAVMHYFLKTLDIPGSGPATAAALVAAKIYDPKTLLATSSLRLTEILGIKTGANLYTNLRTALSTTDETTLMVASSKMPRGVGETKLTSLFALEADPRRWTVALKPAGWTSESLKAFLVELPKYLAWREAQLAATPFPAVKTKVAQSRAASPQIICMTGFRDKALEDQATTQGHTFVAGVTGKTTLLLVPDGEVKESEKVKAARAKGTRILGRTAFVQQYLATP